MCSSVQILKGGMVQVVISAVPMIHQGGSMLLKNSAWGWVNALKMGWVNALEKL
jgi:hypothetical protein